MIRSRENYNEALAFNEFELIPNEWQKIEIAGQTNAFLVSNSDNADFFINFLDTGVYYIDEAILIQNDKDPSFESILEDIEYFLPNLIKNGGFEQNFNSNGIGVHYEYNPSWFPPNSSATMIFQEEECDVYEGFYS